MNLPSGEMATDLIWPEEVPPYDTRVRRNSKSSPPLTNLGLNFPLIATWNPSRRGLIRIPRKTLDVWAPSNEFSAAVIERSLTEPQSKTRVLRPAPFRDS